MRPFTKSLKMNTRISVIEIGKTTDLKIEKTVSLLLFLTWFSLGFLFDYLLPQGGREEHHLFRRGCLSILVLILPTLEESLSIFIRESGCAP